MSRDELVLLFQQHGLLSKHLVEPSLQEINSLRSDPAFCEFLTIDGRNDPGECARRYAKLKIKDSDRVLGKVLRDGWAFLSELARINVCYAAFDAAAMSVDTALGLFLHSHSGTHERHLIVAGLAVSEPQRHLDECLFALAEHIGTYQDSRHQEKLDAFLANLNSTNKFSQAMG